MNSQPNPPFTDPERSASFSVTMNTQLQTPAPETDLLPESQSETIRQPKVESRFNQGLNQTKIKVKTPAIKVDQSKSKLNFLLAILTRSWPRHLGHHCPISVQIHQSAAMRWRRD